MAFADLDRFDFLWIKQFSHFRVVYNLFDRFKVADQATAVVQYIWSESTTREVIGSRFVATTCGWQIPRAHAAPRQS